MTGSRIPAFLPPGAEAPSAGAAGGFSEDDPRALIGQTLAGRYRITGIVGSGGMGTVYRAEHAIIERPVAVKVLAAHCSQLRDVRERFFREARIASRIRHPNVLDVMDLGETEAGRLFLAMELLTGQTLGDRLAESPLTMDALLDVLLEACEGLGAAHEMGVIHRDISPSNIFLLAPGKTTGIPVRVKVLDFGIAFMKSEARLTLPGQVMGTPHYIAPEALKGASITPAADVYSLGATMYEAVAGSPPFEGPTYTEILIKHVTEPPRPLSGLRPDSPPRLSRLIMHCLEKDPQKRPPSMRDVATELMEVGRDTGRRTRRSAQQSTTATPEPGLGPPPKTAGTGLSAWKEYLLHVAGRRGTLPPDQAARVAEMETALGELEHLDEELAARRDAKAEGEERAMAAQHRFGRALETLRKEEQRLDEAGIRLREALAASAVDRKATESRLSEARSRVAAAERGSAARGVGEGGGEALGPAENELLEAYQAAGEAAGQTQRARAAERQAQQLFAEWEQECSDVRFQLEHLVSASARSRESLQAGIEQDTARIGALEQSRAVLWQRLIALAGSLSDTPPVCP